MSTTPDLEKILADYLRAIESQQPVDHEALIAAHPDFADELRSFFQNRAAMERLAQPLRAADTPTMTVGSGGSVAANQLPTIRYFGDYELLEEIARGGMGVVYRARQVSLNRVVALKMILSGQLASDADVQRFRQEAELAANLDHPGIVPIYEIGEHQGQHYFSMKLIEGGNLRGVISDEPAASGQKQSARLMATIARAVHHAHQRGLLHRDLKPGNILLDQQQEPHVTDFGLAKRVEGDSDLTQSGAIVGTPSYMAPEQANATKTLTTAVDIYSLGAILFELLTGRPPFRGSTPTDTILQMLTTEPPRPSALCRHIDRDLETIALKCLEKEPTQRYDSAAALADELERWLRGEPILARPSSSWERTRKWMKRRPAVAALLFALLLVTVVGFAGVFWQWREADAARKVAINKANAEATARAAEASARQRADLALQAESAARQAAESAQRETELARDAERKQRELAEYENYVAKIGLASAKIERSEIAAAEAVLASCPESFRHWEWGRLQWLCHLEDRTFLAGRDPIHSVAFLPDGKTILTSGGECVTKRWELSTGKLLNTLPGDGAFGSSRKFSLSPDGSRLLFVTGHRTAQLWDVKTQAVLHSFQAQDGRALSHALALSPDGKRALTTTGISGLHLWDADTGQQLWTKQHYARGGQALGNGFIVADIVVAKFSHQGHRIVTACQGTLKLWDVAKGEEIREINAQQSHLLAASFSPDDKLLVSSGSDGTAKLWNVETGELVHLLKGHRAEVVATVFSPEGTQVLTASQDHTARLWDVASGHELAVFWGHTGPLTTVTFSPDGSRIITGSSDRTAKLWETANATELRTLRGHSGKLLSAAFSATGKQLLTSSEDGSAKLWDLDVSRELLRIASPNGNVTEAVLSPDGQLLATGSVKGRVELWDAASGKLIRTFPGGGVYGVSTLGIAPDGKRVFAGRLDNTGAVWETETGKTLATIPGGRGTGPAAVAFSRAGHVAITGTKDDKLLVWDTVNNQPLPTLAELSPLYEVAAVSPDGRHILSTLAVSSEKATAKTGRPAVIPTARLWNRETNKLCDGPLNQRGGLIRFVSFLPDGQRLLIDNALWDLESGKSQRQFPGGGLQSGGAISSDFRFFCNGGTIYELDTGREVSNLGDKTGRAVAFSPDNRRLLTQAKEIGKLWDVATGRELLSMPLSGGRFAREPFSADGRRIVMVINGAVEIVTAAAWNGSAPK